MGFGLANGFIDHLYTPLGTTSNYSAIPNLHILQITAAPAKSSPACSVSNSRSLATPANNWDSSATRAQVVSSQPPVQNSHQLSTELQRPLFLASLAELNSQLNWLSQFSSL
jgi:hypothetical protein